MRGRKPVAIEKRLREGNASRRPIPEVMLIGGRPTVAELAVPPDHLPDEAKEFWETSVVRLIEVGVVDRVDVPQLEMMATQYARWRQAQRVLAIDGHFTRGSVGQLREHPSMKIEREAQRAFSQLAEQFGLTPTARARLGLAELSRRSLAAELEEGLGKPKLTARATVVVNV